MGAKKLQIATKDKKTMSNSIPVKQGIFNLVNFIFTRKNRKIEQEIIRV